MGMMARMRSLAPWFIIGVGGLFVLFMVFSDAKVTDIVTNQSNNVGSINGIDITYQEFSNLVEQYRKDQVQRAGQDIPEEQMDAFRDQIWENLVSQKLVEEKIKEFGITVTDQEILELLQGPNPPDVIKQYFVDSTGNFNRQAYDQAIYDPQNKQAMLQTETMVRQQLIQQKLGSFLNASVIVSDADVKRAYIDQNVKMSAEYALVEANLLKDEDVVVTDSDVQNYYDDNAEEFKVEAQRQLKYVLYSTAPNKNDSLSISNNLSAIVKKIKDDTSSFQSYVEIYSEKPYSLDTVSLSLLPGEAGNIIAESSKGSLIGPVESTEGYVVYKLRDVISSKETMVKAAHILVRLGDNEVAAKTKIDEIYAQLKSGADFTKLAIEKSEDGSAQNGGDLGWFGKGQMVKEFEDASFNGKIGEIQKPVKTQFGYHIIKVLNKSDKKYVVEKIVNEIKASATTVDKAYDNANDFSYIANKNDFLSEAELMEREVKETPPFTEEAKVIPGLGANIALLKFAFDSDLNDVSSAFKVAAGYVVATVSKITNAGKKPFEEVKETIKPKVLREKKLEKAKSFANEIKSKLGGASNFATAPQIYSNVKVAEALDFTASGNIPGIGRDLAFSQAALDAPLNKIFGPIKSTRGYYLLKVTQRSAVDSTMYSIQKNSIRDNLLTQKKNKVFSEWIEALKKDSDIVDERYLFYR